MNIAKFLLDNELISILPSVWNWQDAVKIGAKMLVNKGFADQEYPSAIIENTKKNGAYYALVPHVVMPHARPEQGGKKTGVSLLIVKNGVKFHSENDPIHVVLTVVSDTADHFSSEIMPSVATFLEDTTFIQKLSLASNSSDLKEILQSYNTIEDLPSTCVCTSTENNNLNINNKSLHILTVCGVGMGSSLILRMTIEKILKELGINNIRVEHTDVSSASSFKTDLILTAKEFADVLTTKTNTPIRIINNYTDTEAVKGILKDIIFKK